MKFNFRFASLSLYIILFASLVIFIIVDSLNETDRIISLVGLIVILVIGFLGSAHPRAIRYLFIAITQFDKDNNFVVCRWKTVYWGIGVEFFLGLVVLRWKV